MRVIFMRHSIAVDPYATTDEARWLTSEGRARARRLAPVLAEALSKPLTHIFTSPLVRAVQTADLISEGLGFMGAIGVHRALASEYGTRSEALSVLDPLPDNSVVLLVTHEPKVRVLAGHLASTPQLPAFRTGTACIVDVDRKQRGSIAFWLLPNPARISYTEK